MSWNVNNKLIVKKKEQQNGCFFIKGVKTMLYYYGMRYRGCSIGTQPIMGMMGFQDVDKETSGYYSIVYYKRSLTNDEIRDYELTPIDEQKAKEYLSILQEQEYE